MPDFREITQISLRAATGFSINSNKGEKMKKIVALLLSILMLTFLAAPAFADVGTEAATQGFAYYKGEGVAQDYGKAHELFLEADRAGNTQVQFTVGEMYELGYGVEKDIITAVTWYMKAAQLGDPQAAEKLKFEPLRSYSEAMSVQEQATHVPAFYAQEENIRGYVPPLYTDRPISGATDITVIIRIIEILSGWPYGNWYLYVRDPDGNWHHTALLRLDKTMTEGTTRVFHLDLDNPETFTAIALCPADKGMSFSVQFDVDIFASAPNVGEYSSTFPEPRYIPARSDHPAASIDNSIPGFTESQPKMLPEGWIKEATINGDYNGDYPKENPNGKLP